MIHAVNRQHARVAGETATGTPYRADDPELLVWVQATASWGFLEAFAAYDRPISPGERDLYYAEAAPVAARYGAVGTPTTQAQAAALIDRMCPLLEPSGTIRDFLRIMRRVNLLPRLATPLQLRLIKAAIALLPPPIAARLGLATGWRLSGWERHLVRTSARAAGRLDIVHWPSHLARRRLGLTGASQV